MVPVPILYYMLIFNIIVGLPNSNGYNQASVLVNKFTKQIAVLSSKLTWTAKDWGYTIVKYCQQNNWGIPTTIITDHDTKFVLLLLLLLLFN